jgi:hypothetical protein
MFEHLGWMAMAKKHGNDLKIRTYLDGIVRLKECLERKMASTKDEDRKDDLKVLMDNTDCLSECAHRLLDSVTTSSNKECKSNKAHEATYHGLHCWMKHKFEKLGWMCLAKKHGNVLKVQCYMDSIERLKASLEKKLQDLHLQDHKDDIKILHEDVCVLHGTAHKLLGCKMSSHSSKTIRHTKSHKSKCKSKSTKKHTKKTSSWF